MAIIDKLKKAVSNEDTSEKEKGVKSAKKTDKKTEKTNIQGLANISNLVYHGALKTPYITEKSSAMISQNKYVFEFDKNINKIEIRKIIEDLFKVSVLKVSIINTPSRKVRLGRYIGKKSGIKKAIITLKEGGKIDIGV